MKSGDISKIAVLIIVVFCLGISFFIAVSNPFSPFAVSRLFVVEKDIENCSFTLNPGWNMISPGCILENSSREIIFFGTNHTRTPVISAHAYNSSDIHDPWKAYNPDLPDWVEQDFGSFDRRYGYWINTNSEYTKDAFGVFQNPTYTNMPLGWNLMGYTKYNSTRSDGIFQDLGSDLLAVYSYNASANQWASYLPGVNWNAQTLKYLDLHSAFWIKMKKAGVLHVT